MQISAVPSVSTQASPAAAVAGGKPMVVVQGNSDNNHQRIARRLVRAHERIMK
jgi:hypothetical protein